MSEIKIYVEGGGDRQELRSRCREGFRKLLENSGFKGRVPRIVACGSRNDAFDAFKTAHGEGKWTYVALLVDSEDPVTDMEQTWTHIKVRDRWKCPRNAADDQVFLMTTCMETWIIADLVSVYKKSCLPASLPSTTNIEQKPRHDVQDMLVHATRNCSNRYEKNKRSFEALANVNPKTLEKVLPSFARMVRILNAKL